MNRRSLLISTGLIAVASVTTGCARIPRNRTGPTSSSAKTLGGDDSTTSGTSLSVGHAVPLSGRSVQVADAHLVEAVFLDHDVFLSVESRDDEQFVLVDVTVDAEDLVITDLNFEAVVDGKRYRPDFAPSVARGDGTVALPVPVAAASSAGITVSYGDDSATWTLNAGLVANLDRKPAFSVREATVEPTTDGRVALVLAVENAGDRDGTFRALAAPTDVADVAHTVAFDVPVGDTVTHDQPLTEHDDPESVRLVSDWSADTRRFEYG